MRKIIADYPYFINQLKQQQFLERIVLMVSEQFTSVLRTIMAAFPTRNTFSISDVLGSGHNSVSKEMSTGSQLTGKIGRFLNICKMSNALHF